MTGMRILVLGATGFIGPAVVRRAIARGHHPIAVSRTPATPTEGEAVSLNRNDPDALAACLSATRPDAVIDLIAYTERQTVPVLAQVAGRVGRYVLASSADVYRQYDFLHRKDVGEPMSLLDEGAPLRKRPYPYRADQPRLPQDPEAWMDDYDKIPIERALAETPGLSWSILRLPMVFGPGDRNRRFAWAVPPLGGGGFLTLDAQWANWRTSLGYVDDVADALVLAAVHPHAHARTFNVGPREVWSNRTWADALAAACGWSREVRIVPRDQIPEPARSRLDALDLTVPLALDTTAIRQTLGYAEITSLEAALLATQGAETGAQVR